MSPRIFLLLCAATIPASFGLLQDGFFSSSDGMIHLYRLFEVDRAIRAGIFYPRWFPLSGYGYGLPVLNYYPPLAYYVAEFFHLLGVGNIISIKLLIAFGFVLAALSMFLFARALLGTAPGFVAAISFVYLPYLLSDAYIRGNFPEFLAMSLIPLPLFAFHRSFSTQDQRYLALAALSFAAIVLAHHLTAMLVAPLVIAYVLLLFALNRNWRRLLSSVGAIIAALALSAFYWVSAITELNLVFVDPASIPRFLVSRLVSVTDFFAPSLAYSYLPQGEALVHSAGFPQTIMAILAMVVTIMSLRGAILSERSESKDATKQSPASPGHVGMRDTLRAHIIFLFVLLLLSIFMMLNWSAPLWYAVPTLRFMQFPWRWQVLAGVSIAFLIGVWASQIQRITSYQLRFVSYSFLSLAIIAFAIVNLPVRAIPLTDAQLDLQHSPDPDYVVAQMGWSWTREFVPASVQVDTVLGKRARSSLPDSLRTVPSVRIENEGLLSHTMSVSTQEQIVLALHSFFYPGWQAYVDNAPIQPYPSGELGLATVTVPAGAHSVAFRFEETPLRLAMDLVSAFTLIAGIVWLAFSHRRAFVALVVAILLIAAVVFAHNRTTPLVAQPIALDANFSNQALLIAYSTERVEDALYVTLYWFSLANVIQDDYFSFVHLIAADGRILAQNDSLTDSGITPTSRWQRGEIVKDRHTLTLKGASQGQYRLMAGMYLPRENGYTDLSAFDRAGKKIGDEVELGRIQIAQ